MSIKTWYESAVKLKKINNEIHERNKQMVNVNGTLLHARALSHEHEKKIVSGRRLGKKTPRHDPRTLRLEKYAVALPPPPDNCGFVDKVGVDWGMDLNDVIGDCTIAAPAHQIKSWTAYANPPMVDIPQGQVLAAYEAVSGYNPNDPNSDNGAVILDVLKYWRNTGIGGHKIFAFASIDPTNHTLIKQAISLFGSVNIGLMMPVFWQNPPMGVNGNPVWSVSAKDDPDGEPWSWGGHDVPLLGYGIDVKGNKGAMPISWGGQYDITWDAIDKYCDEVWAVLSQDWIDRNSNQSPSGLDLATLQADLAAL